MEPPILLIADCPIETKLSNMVLETDKTPLKAVDVTVLRPPNAEPIEDKADRATALRLSNTDLTELKADEMTDLIDPKVDDIEETKVLTTDKTELNTVLAVERIVLKADDAKVFTDPKELPIEDIVLRVMDTTELKTLFTVEYTVPNALLT